MTSVVVAVVAAGAFGRAAGSSGGLTAAKGLFTTVGCSACHTFKAASATGKIGPNLDTVSLTMTQLQTQISNGGCAVMTQAACSAYKFKMSSFKSRLSAEQIADVAAFVYIDTQSTGSPAKTTTTGKTSTTTTTTKPTTTTTSSTSPPKTVTTTPTVTQPPVAAPQPECAPGVTIQTSGNTDGDDDETGAPSDNDGCL